VDVLNAVTGNLDREGGVMFPLPAAGGPNTKGAAGKGKGFVTGRGRTRVRGFPEAMGELPVSLLAEEITTPGAGQIRALFTFAGNPVLSTPNSTALDAALDSLDFMVSIDPYLNETTRHADVILPPPSHLERSHFDVSFAMFAVRNVANYSPPVFDRDPDHPDEWEILATIAGIAQGFGAGTDPALVDDATIGAVVRAAVRDEHSPVCGRDADELLGILGASGRRGVERILDLLLRTGPYGDAFGAVADGLTLDVLIANPHGVDFGPLRPRMPEVLRTPSGKVELAPPALLDDLDRLAETIDRVDDGQLLLVGRRHLRSNNSWMHNVQTLVKGRQRCVLEMHPQDADARGISDGAMARVTSRVGTLVVPVSVTTDIRPATVSMPHGWGHAVHGTQMRVAATYAGVNVNVLSDSDAMDPLSGNAVLNAIPVTVERL
jgi:anaerobic selenocysteine-containing dehydrogenase